MNMGTGPVRRYLDIATAPVSTYESQLPGSGLSICLQTVLAGLASWFCI